MLAQIYGGTIGEKSNLRLIGISSIPKQIFVKTVTVRPSSENETLYQVPRTSSRQRYWGICSGGTQAPLTRVELDSFRVFQRMFCG